MNENKKICFVLLPGFSSDNLQIMGLKKLLEEAGYTAIAANFYGTEIITDFTDMTAEGCIKNISTIINQASSQYEKVYGIGISLGGALLMEHAKNFDNLSGIVSVGTPFRLKNRKWIALGEWLFPAIYFFWKPLQKIQRLRLSPLGASIQMISYMEGKFLEHLEVITTPILFLHSRKDGVTDFEALDEYVPKISSEKKEIIFFPNGKHVVDDNPKTITDYAVSFFGLS